MLNGGCNNSQDTNLSSTEKLQQEKVLNDPDYINANEATKEAIRQKYKIQPRIVKMPDGTELHFPAGTYESVINNVVQKYKKPLREVKMPDGTIVNNVPISISDTEAFQRYNKSLVKKNNNELPPEVLKKMQEEANEFVKKRFAELEANKNKPIPQITPLNFPSDVAGIERELHRIMVCNETAEKTTNKFAECSNKALNERNFFDRKQEFVCLAELYLEKSYSYCDGFTNLSFAKISSLYSNAVFANEEKYQSIKKQIEALKEKGHQDYMKYINDKENIISNMKLGEEWTKRAEEMERKENQRSEEVKRRRLVEDQEQSDRRMERSLNAIKKGVDMINGPRPQTQTYQFGGGPPIICTTLNGFTSCN